MGRSIKRSWNISKGNFIRIFLSYLLVCLPPFLLYVISAFIPLIPKSGNITLDNWILYDYIINFVLKIVFDLINVFFHSFIVVLTTFMFINLKVKKEGFIINQFRSFCEF